MDAILWIAAALAALRALIWLADRITAGSKTDA